MTKKIVELAKETDTMAQTWSKSFEQQYKSAALTANDYFKQGTDLSVNYLRMARSQYLTYKQTALLAVDPFKTRLGNEKDYFWSEFKKAVVREDNLIQRQNFIKYGSLVFFVGSFAILKKGYIRYSLRNAAFFYGVTSYLICPQNLNPF